MPAVSTMKNWVESTSSKTFQILDICIYVEQNHSVANFLSMYTYDSKIRIQKLIYLVVVISSGKIWVLNIESLRWKYINFVFILH